jgi:hypothetical protein
MTWQYETTSTASRAAMAKVTGSVRPSADVPAAASTSTMASGP